MAIALLGMRYPAEAQIWEKVYGFKGNDDINGAILAPDGGLILAGGSWPVQGPDESGNMIHKITPEGVVAWSRDLLLPEKGTAFGIDYSDDGGYVVFGVRGFQAYLAVTDIEGKVEWWFAYPDSNSLPISFYGGKQAADGGFITIGSIYDGSLEYPIGGSIQKFDPEGNEIWQTSYFTDGNTTFWRVLEMDDGNFVVLAEHRKPVSGGTVWGIMALAYSQNGNLLWTKVVAMPAQPGPQYIVRFASFIKFENSFLIGVRGPYKYIGRLNAANGEVYWEHFLDHVPGTNMGLLDAPICITNDAKVAIASRINGSLKKFWFSRFNIETGEMEWDHIVVSSFDDPPASIDEMVFIPEGGYYLAGKIFSNADYKNIYVMRTDEMGETTATYEQNLEAVEVLVYPNPASGNVFIEVEVIDVDDLEMIVTDVNGRVVRRFRDQRSYILEGLSKGVYFLEVWKEGKSVLSQVKFLII